MTIRARAKLFADMPEWVKCCPKMTECMKSDIAAKGEPVTLIGPQFLREAMCQYCGKVNKKLVAMAVKEMPGKMAYLQLFDLDEGEA